MALLHLVTHWARARGVPLHVLTVDHGLRSESAGEADFVHGVSRDLGWPCDVLAWQGGVASARHARAGRHHLVASACRQAGISHLLIGHTLDDQVETFVMRARRGSGWYGLGGMDRLSPSPAWPEGEGLTLVRPLLAESRPGLRDWLADEGLAWVDDPTNLDTAYERVRARQMLAGAPDVHGRIAALTGRLGILRRAESLAMADIIEKRVTCHGDASLDFDPDGLPEERAVRVLGWLVQAVTGRAAVPREAMLRAAWQELACGGQNSRTLAGAWLVAGQGGRLSLYRDPGAIEAGSLYAHFDNRFARVAAGGPIVPRDGRAALGLPPAGSGPWRALVRPRLAHLCSLWRQLPKLSHLSGG